ncbi:MAG: hypothetical protein ACREXP_07295 [Steroidobacteraceae bacterium]
MALSLLNGENVRAMSASGLQLAVTHLNVPVGPLVTEGDLARALQAGSVAGFDDKVAAVLSYLFVEIEPALIARCARESGSDLRRANEPYKESLQAHLPRVPRWEKAVEHLL